MITRGLAGRVALAAVTCVSLGACGGQRSVPAAPAPAPKAADSLTPPQAPTPAVTAAEDSAADEAALQALKALDTANRAGDRDRGAAPRRGIPKRREAAAQPGGAGCRHPGTCGARFSGAVDDLRELSRRRARG